MGQLVLKIIVVVENQISSILEVLMDLGILLFEKCQGTACQSLERATV